MDAEHARRIRGRVLVLCHAGLDSATLSREAEKQLHSVIPFDRACWHNVDPATSMVTSVHGKTAPMSPLLPVLEYGDRDVNQYAALAQRAPTVGILSQATGGDPSRSRRYREVLEPMEIGDELTASFTVDATFWGCVRLYRAAGRQPFDAVEAAFVAALAPALAEGFRNALLVPGLAEAATPREPGVVLLDERYGVEAISGPAEHWLREIADVTPVSRDVLPHPVYAVATRARAIHETGGDGSAAPARARVPTRSGGWLVLHGVRLSGSDRVGTAVVIEPAPSPEVAPLIITAYGMSERERDVLQQVLRGLSTKQIAVAFGISPYTVADHLKAIFDKTGARSRGELVSRLFFDHYYPRMMRGDGLSPSGWFAD